MDRNVSPPSLRATCCSGRTAGLARAVAYWWTKVPSITAFITADLLWDRRERLSCPTARIGWATTNRIAIETRDGYIWVFDTTRAGPNLRRDRERPTLSRNRWCRHFNFVFLLSTRRSAKTRSPRSSATYVRPGYAAEAALATAQDEAARRDDRWAWFNAGTSAAKLGRYDEAAIYYDEAFRQELPFRMLWYQFGPFETLYHTGRYDELIALADTVAATTPYLEETHLWHGLALHALGRQAEAQAEIEAALAFNANNQAALDAYARITSGAVAAPDAAGD